MATEELPPPQDADDQLIISGAGFNQPLTPHPPAADPVTGEVRSSKDKHLRLVPPLPDEDESVWESIGKRNPRESQIRYGQQELHDGLIYVEDEYQETFGHTIESDEKLMALQTGLTVLEGLAAYPGHTIGKFAETIAASWDRHGEEARRITAIRVFDGLNLVRTAFSSRMPADGDIHSDAGSAHLQFQQDICPSPVWESECLTKLIQDNIDAAYDMMSHIVEPGLHQREPRGLRDKTTPEMINSLLEALQREVMLYGTGYQVSSHMAPSTKMAVRRLRHEARERWQQDFGAQPSAEAAQ